MVQIFYMELEPTTPSLVLERGAQNSYIPTLKRILNIR
jgi:hypothetical protein